MDIMTIEERIIDAIKAHRTGEMWDDDLLEVLEDSVDELRASIEEAAAKFNAELEERIDAGYVSFYPDI